MPCKGWFSGEVEPAKQLLLKDDKSYGTATSVPVSTSAASQVTRSSNHHSPDEDRVDVEFAKGLIAPAFINVIALCVIIFAPWAVVDVAVQPPGPEGPQTSLVEHIDLVEAASSSPTPVVTTLFPAKLIIYSYRSCLWTGKSASDEVENALLFANHTGCVDNKELASLMRALGNEAAQDAADAVEEPETLLLYLLVMWTLAVLILGLIICAIVIHARRGNNTAILCSLIASVVLYTSQGVLSIAMHPNMLDFDSWTPPNSTEPIGNMVFLSGQKGQATQVAEFFLVAFVLLFSAAFVLCVLLMPLSLLYYAVCGYK